ncbi:radical SAM protein [Klebsiella pneumoniae]|uniref:radical SAM protein n=1 Tax=Klebsiella pneumoniae TaxID=573 RepID=UPI001D0E0FD6|nr:radical SAM protein [Klebsiella pneumoniae]
MLDTILIKTASRCNLDCTYCYVYRGADTSWQDQPYRMNDATIEKVVERITEYSLLQETGFAIVLHGGEPLLLGERRLEGLLSGLRRVLNGFVE